VLFLRQKEIYNIFDKNGKRCEEGFFSIAPPPTLQQNQAIFARSTNGTLNSEDQKKHRLYFTMCFTYGTDENNLVHIIVGRQRPDCDVPFGRCSAKTYDDIQNNSSTVGNFTLEPQQIDNSTFLFTITGGGGPFPPPSGCTTNPDNCPQGKYCSAQGNCVVGCKTNPDSCPDGQVCNSVSRSCEAEPPGDKCTASPDTCPLGFFCQVPSGSLTGACVKGCNSNDRCPSPQRCRQGQCKDVNGPSETKYIVIAVIVAVIFIVFIAGTLYFIRETQS
jgi:hypothetical protein